MTDLLAKDHVRAPRRVHTGCCIVGGGPAGMMLGLLLARSGVDVVVLEKYPDFLRDFRGDTVHPATLEILDELGLLEKFEQLAPARMDRVVIETDTGTFTLADFTRLPGVHQHIAFVPQWDFLDLLAREAKRHPTFRLMMSTEATELVVRHDRVVGVSAVGPAGEVDVRARLVIAADGRHSVTREQAGLDVAAKSPEVDVLWLRLPRDPGDHVPFLKKAAGAVLVGIDRGSYWQLAYVIPKGTFEDLRQGPLDVLRGSIAALAPDLADRMDEIRDWEDVKLLSVRVERLRRWYREGFLAIGDAAHAMSPAGGVGINLAIQDAVATANIVGPALRDRRVTTRHLARVQRRRQFPARVMQTFQVRALRDLYPSASKPGGVTGSDPAVFRVIRRFPPLRHLLGRFIGLGIRREHPAQRLTGGRSTGKPASSQSSLPPA